MKGLEEYEIEDDQLDPIYGGVVEQGIEDTIERIIRMKKDEGLNKEAFLFPLYQALPGHQGRSRKTLGHRIIFIIKSRTILIADESSFLTLHFRDPYIQRSLGTDQSGKRRRISEDRIIIDKDAKSAFARQRKTS